MRQIY